MQRLLSLPRSTNPESPGLHEAYAPTITGCSLKGLRRAHSVALFNLYERTAPFTLAGPWPHEDAGISE